MQLESFKSRVSRENVVLLTVELDHTLHLVFGIHLLLMISSSRSCWRKKQEIATTRTLTDIFMSSMVNMKVFDGEAKGQCQSTVKQTDRICKCEPFIIKRERTDMHEETKGHHETTLQTQHEFKPDIGCIASTSACLYTDCHIDSYSM